MPSADTAIVGAGTHVLGNLKLGIDGPNTLVDYAETANCSGWRLSMSEVYAMERAQPFESSIP